jgi:hypothetical protein
MRRLVPIAAAIATIVAAGSALAANAPMTGTLHEQNGSGETGTATLTPEGNKTQVVLSLKGAPAEAQPAHIHNGTCSKLDPKPRIPLQNVVNGKSTTVLDMPIDKVASGAINVHKSAQDVKTYVACGDLKSSM